ncbi:MAG: glycoside hydrolase family 26 protein [Acidimicrobiia bacterium]
MGSSHPQLKVMGLLLAGIGLFVTTTPSAPQDATPSFVRAAAAAPGTGGGETSAQARARIARVNARPATLAHGTDALDGGTPASRTTARATVAKPAVLTAASVHSSRTSATHGSSTTSTTSTTTLPAGPKPLHCSDFHWQQDAQAAYVANLDDPWGLDGPAGPANDDGIACSLLPVDPARPPSVPAGAHPPPPPKPEGMPQTPTMQELLAPTDDFYGVSTPQAPYDWKDFQIFAGAAEKLPSMLEFFVGWDHEFPGDQVVETWRRGALPVLSWEPRPTVQPVGPDSDNTVAAGYTLASIIDGSHDEYIDRFATAVRDLGLPVAIRFAHEMNGNWFPWSEETNGNSKGQYVQAWRHVHDRFTALGATNAIWIWSPNVITAHPSVRLAPLYPGDGYVDWMGMVGYYRRLYLDDKGKPKDPTFANTYQSTLDELRSVALKPIVITELGAVEVNGNKPAWIRSVFQGLADNPDIIGFVWFDHSVNGNDWRIESSDAATEAFASGVSDTRYHPGHLRPPKPGT